MSTAQVPQPTVLRRWLSFWWGPVLFLGFVAGAYLIETNQSHMRLDNEGMRLTGAPRGFAQVLLIHNTGVATQKITSVDSRQPGITMTSTDAIGHAVKPGHSLRVTVRYRVTDCHITKRTGAFPVTIRFDRWWGTHSTSFFDQGGPFTGAYDACR